MSLVIKLRKVTKAETPRKPEEVKMARTTFPMKVAPLTLMERMSEIFSFRSEGILLRGLVLFITEETEEFLSEVFRSFLSSGRKIINLEVIDRACIKISGGLIAPFVVGEVFLDP